MNKVCIIDDNADFCELVEIMLSELNIEFTAFNDYTPDIHQQLTKNIQPDVILLDINLPSIKSFEFSNELLQDLEQACHIIFISGLASKKDKEKAFSAGGFDYIDKSECMDILKEKINIALQASQQKNELSDLSDSMFHSMTQASELGCFLRFVNDSNECNSIDELSKTSFALFQQLGLNTSLAIKTDNKEMKIYFHDGVERPLEKEVILSARNAGRLIDFGRRTLINDGAVSILIRNMPVDDEMRYGMLRDNICFISCAIDAQISKLKSKQHIESSNQVLNSIIKNLDLNSKSLINNCALELEELSINLSEEISKISLTQKEEERLNKHLRASSDKLHRIFEQAKSTEEEISQTLTTLVNN